MTKRLMPIYVILFLSKIVYCQSHIDTVISALGIDLHKPFGTKQFKTKITPYFFCNADDYVKLLTTTRDSNGVFLHEGKYKPTFIFQSGMNAYRYYKENDDMEAKKHFLNQAKWLKNNLIGNSLNQGLWLFNHDKESYFLKKGWPSGLSQGMGLGLAQMAYHETGDKEYLAIMEKALLGYLITVKEGGFLRLWDEMIWFEEYPTKEESRVLNGFIFSIAGLYNLYENTKNELAHELFLKAVKTLEQKIHLYDAAFISKYSLFKKPGYSGLAKQSYHRLHVFQLLWLHEITGKNIFKDYAKKFLEIQRTQLPFGGLEIERVDSVWASSYTSKNSVDHIYDKKWSWGGVWSSYEKPFLQFEFSKARAIFGFSLYYSDSKSEKIPFSVFAVNEMGEEISIKSVKRVGRFVFTSNKNRKTYINTFEFRQELDISKLKLEFEGTNRKRRVTITECNVFVGLDQEINIASKAIKKRIRKERKSI